MIYYDIYYDISESSSTIKHISKYYKLNQFKLVERNSKLILGFKIHFQQPG